MMGHNGSDGGPGGTNTSFNGAANNGQGVGQHYQKMMNNMQMMRGSTGKGQNGAAPNQNGFMT